MFPDSQALAGLKVSIPYIRGDVSASYEDKSLEVEYSLHTWGCFRKPCLSLHQSRCIPYIRGDVSL